MKKLSGGMVKDSALVDQAEGTMRDALNVNLNVEKGSIVNEYGTYEFPQNRNYKVLGALTLDDDTIILFGNKFVEAPVPGITATNYTGQIRYMNPKNQDVIVLYENDNLNFKETHQIKATHRKNQAGEVLVYFTDGYTQTESPYPGFEYVATANPPRVINVTRQLNYRYSGGKATELYNDTNTRHKLQLFPRVGAHAMFEDVSITTGGVVVTGAYYLALAYADNTGLETNYFTMSNPVYITEGNENALPTGSLIGAQGGTATNKSITWKVRVPVDIEYDLLQPVVVQLIDTTKTFYKLPPIQAKPGTIQPVGYSGAESVEILADADVVVDDVQYKSAGSIAQLDNRLYLANVTTNKDIGFQPFAHTIEVIPQVEIVTQFNPRYYDTFVLNQGYSQLLMSFDSPGNIGRDYVKEYTVTAGSGYEPVTPENILSKNYLEVLQQFAIDSNNNFNTKKGYRDPKYSFKKKGYRRGEVYAFYISFVLKDGTETYAYHIPGRGSSTVTVPTTTTTYYEPIHWKKVTFRAVDPMLPQIPHDVEIVFLYMPSATASSSNWASSGYSEGYYRPTWMGTNGSYANTADGNLVDQFQNGQLPCTAEVESTSYFIGLDPETSGGAFGDGSGTPPNYFESWLVNNYDNPIMNYNGGTAAWDSIIDIQEGITCNGGGTTDLLDSAWTVSVAGGGMNETDLFVEHSIADHSEAHGFNPTELTSQDRTLKIYQAVNTSDVNNAGSNMGYWENINEAYPNTSDFLRGIVQSDGTVSVTPTDTLAGERVRHHRFPSNTHGGFESVERVSDGSLANQPEQAFNPETGARISTATSLNSRGDLVVSETVKILGFKLKNLKIPEYILSQVRGYKLYYAKRKPENRLVLGQSIAVPGHPRYASVPQQSLAIAVQGPYKKAFYMYGGLDHTDNSCVDMYGDWRAEGEQRYWGHPIFKFHDFHMLRKQYTLAAATHVEAQYAVIFRMYQGGPGVFVKPTDYDTIKHVWASGGGYTQTNDVELKNQTSTVFPSLGWVSPDMKNTNDFYYHDPAHVGNIQNDEDTIVGVNRVLDISDTFDLQIDDSIDDLKKGKRSRMIKRGDDLSEPVADPPDEQIIEREAKAARIRAWFTSVMVGTVYVDPRAALKGFSFIKGGDYKGNNNESATGWLNRFWGGDGSLKSASIKLAIEPDGVTYLPGRTLYETSNSSSFRGISYLYNEGGESTIALSLVSGLPGLRGHLPRWNGEWRFIAGRCAGLSRWGEGNKWLFPDAAMDGIPPVYQQYGNNMNEANFLNGSEPNGKHNPAYFRGLRYGLTKSDQNFGMPMAWLLNLCSIKTDVFQPFDRQELVWTGFYQEIVSTNTINGAAKDQNGNTTNYYAGAETTADGGVVFGGDTYISKYSFRSTSQSYGHAYWRASTDLGDGGASNAGDDNLSTYLDSGNVYTTNKSRFQNDLPAVLDPNRHGNDFGTTGGDTPVWNWNSSNLINNYGYTEGGYNGALESTNIIKDTWNWVKGNVNPVATLFTFICESDDLIEFSHTHDSVKGVHTKLFDHDSANSYLFAPPTEDFTKADNILYSEHYSALQDIKVASPLPSIGLLADVDQFPRRVVRSNVDSGSLADGYRKFRALEFKDIASHRGDIMNMFVNRGLLYIHAYRSLFLTKGKEELQLSQVNAFIGSGDIFTQDPDEVQESTIGHGGTTSRTCAVTTEHGHFYINYKDRAFYNANANGIETIGKGMATWLRDNIPFAVEELGIDLDTDGANDAGFYVDAPMGTNVPIGFTMGYDPQFKRILITKHEPIPTKQFLDDFYAGNIIIQNNLPYYQGDDCTDPTVAPAARSGEVFCGQIWFGNPRYFTQGGWTISYYPEYGVFGSRHSYRPNLYVNTSEYLLSFTDLGNIDGENTITSWEHSNKQNPGRFYGNLYNFEIEYIDNTAKNEAKLYSTVYYYAEALSPSTTYTKQSSKVTNPVFTEFYVYNSTQISGTPTRINYLNNARLIDRTWYINDFRDMSKQERITEGSLITGTENVAGRITSVVTSTPQTTTMFTEEGVPNLDYIDSNKQWYNRRKLIDHYIGVRLIGDNSNRNLVHLYAVGTKFRKSYR